ncbi:MAG: hypothetical protein FRX49_12892 [Trebouxia sp. A1-2]|nr:MAG: hypothetical protein FRX49_12892 [Trebouxia sp. A1-2]
MYKDNLHEYRVQQAQLRGETPPVKALDPFEEMELKLNSLAQEGKGCQSGIDGFGASSAGTTTLLYASANMPAV